MKTALITGVTGQDGSYLAEFLLKKGYRVFGVIRKCSTFNTSRIDHLLQEPTNGCPGWARFVRDNFFLVYGDLTDGSSMARLISDIEPDEIYNLGAQAHVRVSFDQPDLTMKINALGNLIMLESAKLLSRKKLVKFYQASSSEMFGNHQPGIALNEDSSFFPCSPYAISKCAAFWQTRNARENGMFAVNGILFNHESPRRGHTYVTRKITRAATRIKEGLQKELVLGNLDAVRDWGYAGEYIEAMYKMMQIDEPTDLVIATGQTASVRDFLVRVFNALDLDVDKYVRIDQRYFRPQELHYLKGDMSKAVNLIGWSPTTSLDQLIEMMIESDWLAARQEAAGQQVT